MSQRIALPVLCALVHGCGASPLPHRPGDLPPVGTGAYASVARCTPTAGPATCPGDACATNVVGAADGTTVDLRACGTLDVAFTGGELLARVGQPELAVVVEPPLGAGLRVEASAEGDRYVIVGFAGAPSAAGATCDAPVKDNQVLVDLDECNTIANAAFVRLVYEPRGGTGSVRVDALEALSFKPR